MLKEKRLSEIIEMLRRDGEIEVSQLADKFGVADMTIRRDLDSLAQEYPIERTRGGAVLVSESPMLEQSFEKRLEKSKTAKEMIAMEAVKHINARDKIFIDSGTTMYCLANHLSLETRNIVVTNAINIASELLRFNHVTVLMVGGELYRNTLCCRGPMAEEEISRFRVDKAFLSTNQIGDDGNMYLSYLPEAAFKRNVLKMANETYLLADSSKFGSNNLVSYAHVTQIDHIITDDGITQDTLAMLNEAGVDVIIARGKKSNSED